MISKYSITGTVSGLASTGLVLQNGDESLAITSNGNFRFPTGAANGASYSVTVKTQPSGQVCSVLNGMGKISGAAATVSVMCSTNSYAVGGLVTGLSGTLLLRNNSSEDLVVTTNGSFVFGLTVADGSPYSVSIKNQPTGQSCMVANNSGTVSGATVTTVLVNCSNSQVLRLSLSSRTTHVLAVKTDGTLWAWGKNLNGQLGTGDTTNSNSPLQTGITTWRYVSAGDGYSLAIRSDGTLWAWGASSTGALGLGTTWKTYVPVQLGTDANWSMVSAGYYHTMGIKTDGTLWAWGYNTDGQLGLGSAVPDGSAVPLQVGSDADWKYVSTGNNHTVAIKNNGSLWAWGGNMSGQLGQGNAISSIGSNVPVQIGTDTTWASVTTGDQFTLALKNNGSLWAWGDNSYRQLGLGLVANAKVPTQVGIDTDWVAVSGGGSRHGLAVKTDGSLWAWGSNNQGQLGTGDTTARETPTPIGSDTNWGSIVAAQYHSVSIKTDKTRWTFGLNTSGQLGSGNTTSSNVPIQIGTNTDWQLP